MALASAVLDRARDTMRGFDTRFLPGSTELLRRLTDEERTLLHELVAVDNLSLSLPDDSSDTVDVSTYAVSYALPAGAWRTRAFSLAYTNGQDNPVRRVSPQHRLMVPQFTPSLYILGSDLYPIDGGSARLYGWSGAQTLTVHFITEPPELTAATDTLNAPDEAIPYLSFTLAHFMAVRAKSAEAILREIKEKRQEHHSRLMAQAAGVPGPDTYEAG